MNNSFHYAFTVKDLKSTRQFYGGLLNCPEGRSTDHWVDFDFFGNQISAHIGESEPLNYCGEVDGASVPIPHFGCILTSEEFYKIQHQFETANVEFIIKPQRRYEGKNGQQVTMFVLDYSGNPLEFKTYTDESTVFASQN